jgi:hypothetical protein
MTRYSKLLAFFFMFALGCAQDDETPPNWGEWCGIDENNKHNSVQEDLLLV